MSPAPFSLRSGRILLKGDNITLIQAVTPVNS
jgi:hypothetical protein